MSTKPVPDEEEELRQRVIQAGRNLMDGYNRNRPVGEMAVMGRAYPGKPGQPLYVFYVTAGGTDFEVAVRPFVPGEG